MQKILATPSEYANHQSFGCASTCSDTRAKNMWKERYGKSASERKEQSGTGGRGGQPRRRVPVTLPCCVLGVHKIYIVGYSVLIMIAVVPALGAQGLAYCAVRRVGKLVHPGFTESQSIITIERPSI